MKPRDGKINKIFLEAWNNKQEMETIKHQQELLNFQLKLDEYKDKLDFFLHSKSIDKKYQDDIDNCISGILHINQKTLQIRKVLEERDREFKVNKSIKNNLKRANNLGQSISDLIKSALNIS